MERKWSIRAYGEGDEYGILELWKAVHPEIEYDSEKWLRWWWWMYLDNPAGAGKILLAQHDDKIVGQYALIPTKLKVGREILKVYQNINILTHPDYRKQGMFAKLERQALDEAEKVGVHITIGFPNDASYPGHIKSGWFDISRLQLWLKPLNWGNVIKLKVKNKILQKVIAIGCVLIFDNLFLRVRKPPAVEGLTINQTASFDGRIDDFWTKVCSQHQIMQVRDKDYLNWRYAGPEAHYLIFTAEKAGEISGYLVLDHKEPNATGTKVSTIFDMVVQSENLMHCLVCKAVKDCQQKKVDLILYNLVANKTHHRVLKRNGFVSLPFLQGSRFGAYSTSPSFSKDFLRDPKNWFVQIGDSDAL